MGKVTHFGEFWTAYDPVFSEGTAQRDYQSLEHRKEVDLYKDALTWFVHQSG